MPLLISGGVAGPAASGIITSGHLASGVMPKEVFLPFAPSGQVGLYIQQGLEVASGINLFAWWAAPETYNNLITAELYTRTRVGNVNSGDIGYRINGLRLQSGMPQNSGWITSAPAYGLMEFISIAHQQNLAISNIIFSGLIKRDSLTITATKESPVGTYNMMGLRIVYE